MSIQYNEEQTEAFTLGSSVYGGRPTFALIRDENADQVTLTLYELLPTEQAKARHRRLKRHHQRASKTIPFSEVVNEDFNKTDDWTWDGWVAVKIHQLTGARLRSILELIKEALRDTDSNPAEVIGTGDATVLLREEAGVRLTLGFIGVKPLQRVDRMRALSRGIARMSIEECYYWHAKCRSPNSPSGAKALRTLLTGHKQ